MRRTIIGISTSSSLKQVNILEQIRPSGTLRQAVPIVGIWSSARTVQLFCLSAQQFQRHFPVNNTGSYASEWEPSGRKRRPLFREINWITPTKRAKQGNSGFSSECLVNRKHVELHSTRQKLMISRNKRISLSEFPRMSPARKNSLADKDGGLCTRISRSSDPKRQFDEGKKWN